MPHDRDYFRRRAAEARAASYSKEDREGAALAGDLALAYAALARRRAGDGTPAEPPMDPSLLLATPD